MWPAFAIPAIRHDKIVNLGLPRSGTTWFHAAMAEAGWRSLHCNEADGCMGVDKSALNRAFLHNESLFIRQIVSSFDAFSDLPWYNHLEQVKSYMPRHTAFVVTVRPYQAWSRSARPLLPHLKLTCDALQMKTCSVTDLPSIYFGHVAMVLNAFSRVHVLDLSDISMCAHVLRQLTGHDFNASRLSQHINAKHSPFKHSHKFLP